MISSIRKTLEMAPVLAFGGLVAINLYMWHRQGDMADSYVDMTKKINSIHQQMHDMEIRLLKTMHDKEQACAVLQASISNKDYSHKYCKD